MANTSYPRSNWVLFFFEGGRVARSIVFCAMFCRSLFVLLYSFSWSLYCMSFLDLSLLITPLVSKNISSYPVYYILFQFHKGCIMWHSLIRFYIPWADRSYIRNLACYHIIHMKCRQLLTNVFCRIRNLTCYHIIYLKSLMDSVSHSVWHNNIREVILLLFVLKGEVFYGN